MKRQAVGGAHRGPAGLRRQRRTLRLVQILLVLIAGGLLMFAGYSLGVIAGMESAQRSGELGAPAKPSALQPVALAVLGLGAFSGALLLQAAGGIRLPTPARLEAVAGAPEPGGDEARSEGEGRHAIR